ncbi:Lrp/AsnC family transcriptional regulator [Flavobacterium cerinum]|uniref:Lrp/AsnC family transcriptional regulator n=1 Tax=Flavobacterium cerinum TaxID=2502784 RepID=A0ABY5IPC4_9FLAO|nr:Lrp/AsnC family transcriptional regulator [Flavobacterium cerinum]UUC44685.1 Lrp/AsnC family transcriptional regulator [Flavobacterium cerinum]
METLDKFDLAILKVLQKDNLTPQRTIGESIGLSAAAVQRRIKRMRETGVIAADITVVDREKAGRMITLFVEVKLESEQLELIDQAKSSFLKAPEVQQCYYVTGETDFVLVIISPSMHDYEQLTRRLFFSNKNIKSFRTSVALDIVKQGLEIPLDL